MTFDVPPQEILTKDSVTVAVDAVVYWRIFNPTMSVTNVADAPRSTKLLAATSLRYIEGDGIGVWKGDYLFENAVFRLYVMRCVHT